MSKPQLFGADYSVYVRIARMTLIEKGVDHELVPVDVFAADGPPDWYADHHPFGRIPAFADGDFKLYETAAITRYVDEGFDGPRLQPEDARRRARMTQMIGMLDAYAYRPMVWDVAVQVLESASPDQELVAAGLQKSKKALDALARLKEAGPWLLGGQLTLTDLHAAPIVGYFLKAPEGRSLLAQYADLSEWFARVASRPSFQATEAAA